MELGSVARRTYLYDVLQPAYAALLESRWRKSGRPLPAPSAVKRRYITQVAESHNARVLVETGTYRGDTVRALRNHFDLIYSIEVVPALYVAARRRCRWQVNAQLLLGDSASHLPSVLGQLFEPALFWLDAHASGGPTGQSDSETPVERELSLILGSPVRHIVLVDDLREFEAGGNYPSTREVAEMAARHDYSYSTANDIITLLPR